MIMTIEEIAKAAAVPLTAVPPTSGEMDALMKASAVQQIAARTQSLAQQAPATPLVFNLPSIVASAVKTELAKLKLEGVTFEHKVGVAVLKYWPIAAGLVVAATRFL
jgi:hypothetical protein